MGYFMDYGKIVNDMITRILIAFMLFAAIAYYYNIDVRAVVAKSGVPEWLASHGITPHSDTAAVSDTATDTAR